MQQVAACFGLAVRVIQAVVVDRVTGPFSRSARHQRACNHARTVYTLLTVSEKKFDVLPACKYHKGLEGSHGGLRSTLYIQYNIMSTWQQPHVDCIFCQPYRPADNEEYSSDRPTKEFR
jgi:hypothetical protein